MKKTYLFLNILTLLICVCLIPINLFLAFFPEWLVGIFVLLSALTLVIFYIKGKGKKLSKILLTTVTTITVVFSAFASYCNPYWNSLLFKDYPNSNDYNQVLTFNQAKEDIDCMMKYLKKDHPLFLNSTPAPLQQAYDKSIANLKNSQQITVNSLLREMHRILAVLHDGHTTVYDCYSNTHHMKYMYQLSNGGYSLSKVNGKTIPQLFEDTSDLFSYEMESWGIQQLKSDLTTLEGLDLLGIDTKEGITYTYESENGSAESVTCYASDFLIRDEYYLYNEIDPTQTEPDNFVSYAIDEDKSLAILTLNRCWFNDEYCKCLNDMFTEVKEKKIRNVAVDLRANGGGASAVAFELIRYLDVDSYNVGTIKWRFGFFNFCDNDDNMVNQKYHALTFDGELYLLTSNNSFSSAMQFAEYIKDNKLGIIIGEAPGNTPEGYGETATFLLPNSKLFFQVSTKQFFRADKTVQENVVSPDIACSREKAVEELLKAIE
ncbi:S41 family peptidase [Anaerosporobacter sp.]|uniref:S41 family peptidase n=1 Tax=Anaerosporobacter sp. TaxID=1872529 RepID=UPI00286EFC1F|nr:S41 family peptidase [Anaerosporobacter sp.]